MSVCICTKEYAPPPLNVKEALRYAGGRGDTPTPELQEAWELLAPARRYSVCWARLPVQRKKDVLDLTFAQTPSRDLQRALLGCEELLLTAATVGLGPDRLAARYGRLAPAKALLIGAIGTERVESLLDVFAREQNGRLQQEGLRLTPRFSPGYGDLPLQLQAAIIPYLDTPKRIGVVLNESLLMSPAKSVTAIIGIRRTGDILKEKSGCDGCRRKDCEFRR